MMSKVNQLKHLDEEFDKFISEALYDVTETELTPEKAADRKARANKDDLEFCRIYYPKIFDSPFNDLHKEVAGWEKGKMTLGGYRKSGKTAFVIIGKLIKRIALGNGGIINLCLRTEDVAKERTSSIHRIITRNKMLMYDYNIEVQQDLKGYYIINNTTLVATSVKMGLRNFTDDDFKRFSLSINDDLYNKNTVTSEADNKKVTDFVTSEVYGQMEEDSLCITLGNSINDDCPIERLKKEFPGNHYELPHKDEAGNPTWPERHSIEYWGIKEAEIPYDVLMNEYYLKPAEEGEVFDKDWLHLVNVNILPQLLATISAIDPSFGQSPSACYKGIATVGILADHRVITLDLFLKKEGYPFVFDYLDRVRNTYPAFKAILFENDFAQWTLAAKYYLDWMQNTGKVLPLITHNSKNLKTEHRASDKESRIMNLVHPHQTGMLIYNQELKEKEDYKLYKRQYFAFGKHKEKLDGLDAMATAYIMVARYIQSGNFQSLGDRQFKGNNEGSWFR